jgi:hypothetical protein
MKQLTALMIGVLLMLNGCMGNDLAQYKGTEPKLEIKEYFNGPVKAWGVVQDWRGRVISRFDVTMVGEWDGNTGTLKEDFHYYDGSTQQRTWYITRFEDGLYEGRASDILDTAQGKSEGSAVNWAYTMDVPVGDDTYRLRFDDWMWLMHDGVLVNRSYLKKFGITVAELTIFMQKQEQ